MCADAYACAVRTSILLYNKSNNFYELFGVQKPDLGAQKPILILLK